MHTGVQRATGDWLLFSDGDVSLRPATLRRAITYCDREGLDMLAVLPGFRSPSFLIMIIWAVFLRGMMMMVSPRRVRDPRSPVAMGSGGFNLVRRAAFERTPGFEHLRLETADDVGLGLMVKQAGGRLDFMDGAGLVEVPLYRGYRQLLRGLEKNGSTTAAYPVWAVAGALLLLWSWALSPLAAVVRGPGWIEALGLLAFGAYTAAEAAVLHRNSGRCLPALLWPIGAAGLSFALLRATWLARRNQGVRWRDTFYSLEELAAGRRVPI